VSLRCVEPWKYNDDLLAAIPCDEITCPPDATLDRASDGLYWHIDTVRLHENADAVPPVRLSKSGNAVAYFLPSVIEFQSPDRDVSSIAHDD